MRLLVLTAALALLAACGIATEVAGESPGTSAHGTSAPAPTLSPTTAPSATTPSSTLPPTTGENGAVSTTTPSGAVGGVAVAVADLAQRLGVAQDEIELVSQEEVTWRDGSMGCRQKGMSYIQQLTNGTRIVLRAGGRTYEYHSGGARPPFYCPNPEPPYEGSGGGGDL